MQAKPGVIDILNTVLSIELTAVNQYFVQAEMCRNWGFDHLYEKFRASSMEEMQDAQALVRHILFLDGVPNMQRLNQVRVGENVLEDLNADLELELNAVQTLAGGIAHCAEVQDFATRLMLEQMQASEQEQVDWLETQLEVIRQIGIENYLTQQLH
jgi:bacterioferritin